MPNSISLVQINHSFPEKTELEWLNFIKNNSSGIIFQSPLFYKVYLKTINFKPIVLLAYRNNKLEGVLFAVIQKEYKGLLGYLSSRSIIMGGPVVKNDDSEILEYLVKKYLNIIKNRSIYSQIRNLINSENQKDVFLRLGFRFEEHLNIHIFLPKTEQEYWNSIKSKTKNKIRKAFKNNIQFGIVKTKEELEDVYNLLKEVYNKVKLPLPDISLFYSAWDNLEKNGHLKIFTATKDHKMIGCRLELIFENKIYDWYAGSKQEYNKYNVNDFLPYKVICWAIDQGYKLFDFGGAGHPGKSYGVRDHKLKFGGSMVNYGRYNIIHAPLLFQISKTGLRFWQIIKKIKIESDE